MKVTVCAVVALVLIGSIEAASQKRDLQIRQKRSFSWLPPILGGGSSDSETEDAVENEELDPVDARNQNLNYVSGQANGYPDASIIESIVSKGQVVNDQVHYPIWRVHKYNGVHLQPIPVSLIQNGNQIIPQQSFGSDPEHRLPEQQNLNLPTNGAAQNFLTTANAQGVQMLPPDLLHLANQFGITDLSKFPSLDEAMNLLGTTTPEETIKTIQEIAATEDGRNLIRSFIAGNGEDNEVAASEVQENVESEENAEKRANSEGTEGAEGAGTSIISQYLLPGQDQSSLFGQLPFFGQSPVQSEQESEYENAADEVETTTPSASIYERVSQWVNFLNPLTNRQEIPIPPSESELNAESNAVKTSSGTNDEAISNGHSVPIPNLPELPPLPKIPGADHPLPPLPNIHIPTRFAAPNSGHYVRVKLPLAGFNPTPQIPIDAKYLYHAQNQLQQQQQPIATYSTPQRFAQQPYVQYDAPSAPLSQRPIQVYHRIATTVREPAPVTSSLHAPQSAIQQHLQLPAAVNQQTFHGPSLSPTATSSSETAHVGQLPLIPAANYEVFKNAPQIITSYGTPALPYTYSIDGASNTFRISPQASAAFIHQEYELRPAASDIVEQSIEKNAPTQTIAAEKEEEEVEEEMNVERSNQNEEISSDRKNDNTETESTAAIVENLPNEPVAKSSEAISSLPNKSVQHNLKDVTANHDKGSHTGSHIQRITPHDTVATGKLHKADPKAIEMLPFTVRHVLEDQREVNDEQ